MTKYRSHIFFASFLLLLTLQVQAQFLYDRYVNLKFGQGIVYGGRGLNIEYRLKHFSMALTGGYQGEQYLYDHNVASSYNIGANVRYYYYRKQGSWQLYTGLYMGWLNDYYNPDIAEKIYNSTVYGSAFLIGLEIREELFNVEIGTSIDPGILVFQPEKHPYYNRNWYVSPNIGIGVNLYALRSSLKFKKQHKHSTTNTTIAPIFKDTTAKSVMNAIHERLIHQQAVDLINSCENHAAILNEKAYYQNDTLYIFKQVGIHQYIYGKMYLPNVPNESFYTTTIEPLNTFFKIYLIEDHLTVQTSDELSTLYEEVANITDAKQGVLSLYINERTCYVKLEQVLFKSNHNNIYFDSISLCKIAF
jgi:hypothetical protein